ncbi:MAG: hypothetical protein RLN81_02910 [Balneolaceae bacterium]
MFSQRVYILFFAISLLFVTCTDYSEWPENETSVLVDISPDKSKKIELITKKVRGFYSISVTDVLSGDIKITDEVFASPGYHKNDIKTYWSNQSDTVFIEIDNDFGDNNVFKIIPLNFQ